MFCCLSSPISARASSSCCFTSASLCVTRCTSSRYLLSCSWRHPTASRAVFTTFSFVSSPTARAAVICWSAMSRFSISSSNCWLRSFAAVSAISITCTSSANAASRFRTVSSSTSSRRISTSWLHFCPVCHASLSMERTARCSRSTSSSRSRQRAQPFGGTSGVPREAFEEACETERGLRGGPAGITSSTLRSNAISSICEPRWLPSPPPRPVALSAVARCLPWTGGCGCGSSAGATRGIDSDTDGRCASTTTCDVAETERDVGCTAAAGGVSGGFPSTGSCAITGAGDGDGSGAVSSMHSIAITSRPSALAQSESGSVARILAARFEFAACVARFTTTCPSTFIVFAAHTDMCR
eukprot:PhM_4_TR6682/c0_g1_i1/m.20311